MMTTNYDGDTFFQKAKDLVTCKYKNCGKFYVKPVRLDCHQSICSKHLDDLKDDCKDGFFSCKMCNQLHKLTDSSFPINTDLEKILDLNFHLNENQIMAKENIKQLDSTISQIESAFDTYLEQILQTKKKILHHCEIFKYSIDKHVESLLKSLDDLKIDGGNRYKNLEKSYKENFKVEADSAKNKVIEVLNPNCSEDTFNLAIKDIKEMNLRGESKLVEIQDKFSKLQIADFTPYNFDPLSFGSLDFKEKPCNENKQIIKNEDKVKTTKSVHFDDEINKFDKDCCDSKPLKKNKNNDRFNKNNFIENNIYFDKISELKGHSKPINCLTYLKTEDKLASASSDTKIKIWNIRNDDCEFTLKGHSNRVTALAHRSNSDELISGSKDRTIKIWNLKTNQCTQTLIGHSGFIMGLYLNGTQNKLISIDNSRVIFVWDLSCFKCIKSIENDQTKTISCLQISQENKIATGSIYGEISFSDMETNKHEFTLLAHNEPINCLEFFTSNPNKLASGSDDFSIKIWNVKDKVNIETFVDNCIVTSLRFLSNEVIVSGNANGLIKVWSLCEKKCVNQCKGHPKHVQALVVTNTNELISCSTSECIIKIWSIV